MLELARYVVLNPVRAGMVLSPNEWEWSSYRWTAADAVPPPWLQTDWLLSQFAQTRCDAVTRYREFVRQGHGCASPLANTKFQLILGDVAFAAQQRVRARTGILDEISKAQRQQAAMPLAGYRLRFPERDEAMARAFWCTAYTMAQIAAHFGVSSKTVSRAVRRYETLLAAEIVPDSN